MRATEPAAPARPSAAVRPAAAAAGDSRAPNLFQRITGAFSAPKGLTPVVTAGPAQAASAAEPPVHAASPAPRPLAAPENVVAVAPKPAATPRPAVPVQTSISLDVTERAKPARDDDDLQIPAFLRRQAN